MKDIREEERPAAVAEMSKQAGDAHVWKKWKWVEPSIWTDRMLTALEEGVKGGKWFALMDKVYSGRNLEAAWAKVRANKGAAGVDHQSIEAFEYFRHSQKSVFQKTDGWIRMRLRSILRKRHGRKGRGRGFDHLRWPNAYFGNLGLFTLTTAHESARQSRCGNH